MFFQFPAAAYYYYIFYRLIHLDILFVLDLKCLAFLRTSMLKMLNESLEESLDLGRVNYLLIQEGWVFLDQLFGNKVYI